MRPFLPAFALLALGSSALAGPKPPTTAEFEPEIGYTYASGNYMDLRLANRAGDKAILVHRTGFGKLRSFDLSDEASKRIVYIDDTTLFVRTWSIINGAVAIGGPDPIFAGPGLPEIPDFSPDGSKIAFSVLSPTEPGIRIYDFNAPAAGTPLLLTGWNAFTVRWHPDGQRIYFSGYQSGMTSSKRLFLWDPQTGSVDRISNAENVGFGFDVGRSNFFSPSEIIALDVPPRVDIFNAAGGLLGNFRNRSLAHFHCSGNALIARNDATRRRSVFIFYLFGAAPDETWSADSNIHHTDWMRRVPCV